MMHNMASDNPGLPPLPPLPPSPRGSWPLEYQPEDDSSVNLSRHEQRASATIGHVGSFPVARSNGRNHGSVEHFSGYEHTTEVARSDKGSGNPALTRSASGIDPPSSPQGEQRDSANFPREPFFASRNNQMSRRHASLQHSPSKVDPPLTREDPPEEFQSTVKRATPPRSPHSSSTSGRHQECSATSQYIYATNASQERAPPPRLPSVNENTVNRKTANESSGHCQDSLSSSHFSYPLNNAQADNDNGSIRSEASRDDDATILSYNAWSVRSGGGGGASVASHRSHGSTREEIHSKIEALNAKSRALRGITYLRPSSNRVASSPAALYTTLSYSTPASCSQTLSALSSSSYSPTSVISSPMPSSRDNKYNGSLLSEHIVPSPSNPPSLSILTGKYSQKSTEIDGIDARLELLKRQNSELKQRAETSNVDHDATPSNSSKKVTFEADYISGDAIDVDDSSVHSVNEDGEHVASADVVKKLFVHPPSAAVMSNSASVPSTSVTTSISIISTDKGTDSNNPFKANATNSHQSKLLAMKILSEKILHGYTMTRNRCPNCDMALLCSDATANNFISFNADGSLDLASLDNRVPREECVFCPVNKLRKSISRGVCKRVMAVKLLSGLEIGTPHGRGVCDSCLSPKLSGEDEKALECQVCLVLDSACIEIVREQGRGGVVQEFRICIDCGSPEVKQGGGAMKCVVCDVMKMKLKLREVRPLGAPSITPDGARSTDGTSTASVSSKLAGSTSNMPILPPLSKSVDVEKSSPQQPSSNTETGTVPSVIPDAVRSSAQGTKVTLSQDLTESPLQPKPKLISGTKIPSSVLPDASLMPQPPSADVEPSAVSDASPLPQLPSVDAEPSTVSDASSLPQLPRMAVETSLPHSSSADGSTTTISIVPDNSKSLIQAPSFASEPPDLTKSPSILSKEHTPFSGSLPDKPNEHPLLDLGNIKDIAEIDPVKLQELMSDDATQAPTLMIQPPELNTSHSILSNQNPPILSNPLIKSDECTLTGHGNTGNTNQPEPPKAETSQETSSPELSTLGCQSVEKVKSACNPILDQEIVKSPSIESGDSPPDPPAAAELAKQQDKLKGVVDSPSIKSLAENSPPLDLEALHDQLRTELMKAKKAQSILDRSIQNNSNATTTSNRSREELKAELGRTKQAQLSLEKIIEATKATSEYAKPTIFTLGQTDDAITAHISRTNQSYSISQQEVDATGNLKEYIPPPSYFSPNIPSEVLVYHIPEDGDPSIAAQSHHMKNLKRSERYVPSKSSSIFNCCGGAAADKHQNHLQHSDYDFDTIDTDDDYTIDYTLNTMDDSRTDYIRAVIDEDRYQTSEETREEREMRRDNIKRRSSAVPHSSVGKFLFSLLGCNNAEGDDAYSMVSRRGIVVEKHQDQQRHLHYLGHSDIHYDGKEGEGISPFHNHHHHFCREDSEERHFPNPSGGEEYDYGSMDHVSGGDIPIPTNRHNFRRGNPTSFYSTDDSELRLHESDYDSTRRVLHSSNMHPHKQLQHNPSPRPQDISDWASVNNSPGGGSGFDSMCRAGNQSGLPDPSSGSRPKSSLRLSSVNAHSPPTPILSPPRDSTDYTSVQSDLTEHSSVNHRRVTFGSPYRRDRKKKAKQQHNY